MSMNYGLGSCHRRSHAGLRISSLYFFPRVFGDAETKAMYKIESILKSYVNTKSYNLVDLMNHTFHAGTYEYQNDKLQFSFGIKTD